MGFWASIEILNQEQMKKNKILKPSHT